MTVKMTNTGTKLRGRVTIELFDGRRPQQPSRRLTIWQSPTGAKLVRFEGRYYKWRYLRQGWEARIDTRKPYTYKGEIVEVASPKRRKLSKAELQKRTVARALKKAKAALSAAEFEALGLHLL